MKTTHKILFGDARRLPQVPSETVALVVTSPPYPMIEMWDEAFCRQDPDIERALAQGDGNGAFELMHRVLDGVWDELYRVLMPGGFACINVGDATRTLGGHFRLYANHARILSHCVSAGFSVLPAVIWRKQTNAPNKFMGSGTLPAGAYVTLEHEFVLILRKGNRREFKTPDEKLVRSRSALFWEERNAWFSDVWFDLKGAGQALNHEDVRKRSGAFPFELPYRLVNMFSVRGDTVLDPFLGTGTTTLAALASARNSIGVEIDPALKKVVFDLATKNAVKVCNARIQERIESHLAFVKEREQAKGKGAFKYTNETYGFPVMTKPETKMLLNNVKSVKRASDDVITATYHDVPAPQPRGKTLTSARPRG